MEAYFQSSGKPGLISALPSGTFTFIPNMPSAAVLAYCDIQSAKSIGMTSKEYINQCHLYITV